MVTGRYFKPGDHAFLAVARGDVTLPKLGKIVCILASGNFVAGQPVSIEGVNFIPAQSGDHIISFVLGTSRLVNAACTVFEWQLRDVHKRVEPAAMNSVDVYNDELLKSIRLMAANPKPKRDPLRPIYLPRNP